MPRKTIHIPEGERGDEVAMQIIPNIYKMAQGEHNA